MTPRGWKPRALQLARSQLGAAILGLAMAHGFWWYSAPGMQRVLDGITRHPLAEAARLAFRFGSEAHARALLSDLKRTPGIEELGQLDDMVIELKLGTLDAEQDRTEQLTPHLNAAIEACRRARAHGRDGEVPNCAPSKLRALMVELAAGRLVPRSG